MTGKLEFFEAVIKREVEARKTRAKHQLAVELSEATAAGVEAAQEQACHRVETARREQEREANIKIAAATADAKREYNAARAAFFAEIVGEVRRDLVEFMRSEEYEGYLQERIAEVKAMKLAGTSKAEAVASPEGGFVLQSKNGRMRGDYTFATRLEDLQARYVGEMRG